MQWLGRRGSLVRQGHCRWYPRSQSWCVVDVGFVEHSRYLLLIVVVVVVMVVVATPNWHNNFVVI